MAKFPCIKTSTALHAAGAIATWRGKCKGKCAASHTIMGQDAHALALYGTGCDDAAHAHTAARAGCQLLLHGPSFLQVWLRDKDGCKKMKVGMRTTCTKLCMHSYASRVSSKLSRVGHIGST